MSAESLLSLITGGAGALSIMGIWMTLMIMGKLHTDGEVTLLVDALNREKAAHDETKRALAAASDRADAAVRASELVSDAFASASQRRKRETPRAPA